MQLPITDISPIVREHAPYFHALFQNEPQVRHFDNYLTELTAVPILKSKKPASHLRLIESAKNNQLKTIYTILKST